MAVPSIEIVKTERKSKLWKGNKDFKCKHAHDMFDMTMRSIYNQDKMQYYSAIKRMKSDLFDNTDRHREYYAQWHELKKNKYCVISLIYGILKSKMNKWINKAETNPYI